jgi:hypothetical protein
MVEEQVSDRFFTNSKGTQMRIAEKQTAADILLGEIQRVSELKYIVPYDSLEARPLYSALKTCIFACDARQVNDDDITSLWAVIDLRKSGIAVVDEGYGNEAISAARDFTNFKLPLDVDMLNIGPRKKTISKDVWVHAILAIDNGEAATAIDLFATNGKMYSTAKEYVSSIRRYLKSGIFNTCPKGVCRPPQQLFEAACICGKTVPVPMVLTSRSPRRRVFRPRREGVPCRSV